jgi:hypothetical protein
MQNYILPMFAGPILEKKIYMRQLLIIKTGKDVLAKQVNRSTKKQQAITELARVSTDKGNKHKFI